MNIFHSWQFLLGISILAYSCAILFQRLLMKDQKTDGVTFSISYQLLVGIIIGILAFIHGFHMPNLLKYVPNTLIMIIFYGFGNICIFKALGLLEVSEFTVLLTTRSLWTILISVLFLHEQFLFLQIIGTCFILGSVMLINLKEHKFVLNKGLWLTLLAGFLFGVAFANDAFLLQRFDELSYVSIAFILPALGMLFFYPKTIKKSSDLLLPGILWKLIIFASLYSLAAMAIFAAYQVGRNAAQISIIGQVSTILTVILAVIFLKETKGIFKKLLATLLAFIGVLLVG